jgi:hypothetical protein
LAEELDIPVAYCATCDDLGPVVVKIFKTDEDSPGSEYEFTAIYCPECDQVINLHKDVELEWYSASELHKATGWKVVD